METEPKKILIVDDDKSVRDFLGRFLSMKGYEHVQSVETGQEAVEIVKKDNFKLVLLDIKYIENIKIRKRSTAHPKLLLLFQ